MDATAPRKRRKDARPSELTAAALDLFVERGFAATRLDDVARAAGVSKGTLYLYFDSKEALFQAVIQEGIVPVVAESELIFAGHTGDSFELMRKLLDNWWAKIGSTRLGGIPKLMVAEARNFPDVAQFYYDHVISRGRSLVGNALERGMQRGEFRRMDVNTAIDLIMAPILMLLIWRHSLGYCQSGQNDPVRYLNLHLDLLREGLIERKQESQV